MIMKKRFLTLLCAVLATSFGSVLPQKRLVLHVDVNKTIIAMDLVQGKELEETVNGILAEFTFAKWDGNKEQSFYDYLTDQIIAERVSGDPNANVQELKKSEEVKKERSNRLRQFSIYLKDRPELLAKYNKDKNYMVELLGAEEMVIFPSFFRLIEWLKKSNYKDNFAVNLRTFGQDLPKVIPAIQNHPTGSLQFSKRGGFKGETLNIYADVLGSDDKVVESYNTPQELYTFFTNPPLANNAIRDDYMYWKSKGFSAAGGKLFPINLQDKDVVTIFFDDNATDPDKPIVHPISPQGQEVSTTMLLQRGNLVGVNPKEAILDNNYFIDKVKKLVPDITVEQTQTGSSTKEDIVPAPPVEKAQPSPAKSSNIVNKLRKIEKSLKAKIASLAQKHPAITNKLKQQLQQLERKIKALIK